MYKRQVELDIIKKSGSWFSYNGQKLGQGRDNVKEILKSNPELMKEIEEKILEHKDEIAPPPKKSKKDKLDEAAKEASENSDNGDYSADAINTDDILADIEEDFEEFTPAED